MTPVAVTACTVTTAVGTGNDATMAALRECRSGLSRYASTTDGAPAIDTWVGRVAALDDRPLPAPFTAYDCRNHRLAWLALAQDGFLDAARAAVRRHGATRVGVFVGTSTSTIAASEDAYATALAGDAEAAAQALSNPRLHHLHATTAFVQHAIGACGPAATVSTACSSSAKAFSQAHRWLAAGLVDAAVVGGVDSLARSTLHGFAALGLVSTRPCRPFDPERDGINLGEGAGFALLERADAAADDAPLLVGYGESSDAHHMSAPHPDGAGARDAIALALASAGLAADRVDYVNLHGTATPKNDEVEARVVERAFPRGVAASSTKGWTGHALGAAGIVEAIVTLLALRHGLAPGTLGIGRSAPPSGAAAGPIRFENREQPLAVGLSLAFAFGGNNSVLAFARDRRALDDARGEAR